MFRIDFAEKIFIVLLTFPEIKKTCIFNFIETFYPGIKQKILFERIDIEYVAGNITIGNSKTNWHKYYLNPTGLRFFHQLLQKKYITEDKIKISVLLHILFLIPQGIDKITLEKIYSRYQLKTLFGPDSVNDLLIDQMIKENVEGNGEKFFLSKSGLEYLQSLGQ